MPHLRFEINRPIPDAEKTGFAGQVRRLFSEVMATGTDHISVTIRDCGTHDLSIGRVTEPEKGVALVHADLRRGRSIEQRRELALGFIELLHRLMNVPPEHVYITFTEHPGEDFHLSDRFLGDWHAGED